MEVIVGHAVRQQIAHGFLARRVLDDEHDVGNAAILDHRADRLGDVIGKVPAHDPDGFAFKLGEPLSLRTTEKFALSVRTLNAKAA